ncbi:hypothetical protein ACHAXA_001421 [Cyclostephanos tholiformis]|uniref:CAF1B/HIR1 beta-propeller domain-containing protein n=1 Tax=Cyclostephanos tholiformis TaxID=382380 RepID=A0ABD3RJI5_9STRA
MKVETPQLRWHQIVNPQCQKDAGANGPILSCSLHTTASTAAPNGEPAKDGRIVGVLATAGNSEVNLWKVRLTSNDARHSYYSVGGGGDVGGRSSASSASSRILVQPQTKCAVPPECGCDRDPTADVDPPSERTAIEHVITLSRGTNDRGINCVRFSPSGRYLVAAGDGGTVVVYALLPPSSNGDKIDDAAAVVDPSRWTTLERETDLSTRTLFNQSDDVMDVAWSADSRRFVTCSLDHTLSVWEYQNAGGGSSGLGSGCGGGGGGGGGGGVDGGNNWRTVHRSARDHTHYIQGVAYDPRGVYLASMGSDRMIKVYARKEIREGTLSAEMAKYQIDAALEEEEEDRPSSSSSSEEMEDRIRVTKRPRDFSERRAAIMEGKVLPGLLTNSAFVLQSKIKTLKFLNANGRPTTTAAATVGTSSSAESSGIDDEDNSSPNNNNGGGGVSSSAKRHHMFVDELTLGSFFRRLSFTVDGAFLVVPAALWHGRRKDDEGSGEVGPSSPTSVLSGGVDKLADSSFATYLFARHHFDQPYKVLTGLEKPSVVVRPNPVLFRLPPNVPEGKSALPYRSVFAVLTTDSVVIYDTHHYRPLSLARGLHYAGLTDAAWSADGQTLFVTSSDGYVSILSFGVGELGDVYTAPMLHVIEKVGDASEKMAVVESEDVPVTASEDECRKRPESKDGCVNKLVPKTQVEETVPDGVTFNDSDNGVGKKKVRFGDPLDDRSNQPDREHPAINNLVPKKKKKKIAPTHVEMTQKIEITENNRAAEELVTPINESQGTSVNILVAKKKTKVAASLDPITTICEKIE